MKLITLAIPLLLVAISAHASWTLLWDPNDPSDGVTSYKVYERTGTTYNAIVSVTPSSTPSYVISALPRGTHYFAVTALNSDGESSYSNEVSIVVKKNPSAPRNLHVQ